LHFAVTSAFAGFAGGLLGTLLFGVALDRLRGTTQLTG
jgi:hypothetical protein